MKMSLTTGITNARGTFGAPNVNMLSTGMVDVPNQITFDSTTSFSFCTSMNKVPHAYCEIIGFATWYKFESASNGGTYFVGLYRTFFFVFYLLTFFKANPVAFYEFNQGSGHAIADSYNNLGNAYLGI